MIRSDSVRVYDGTPRRWLLLLFVRSDMESAYFKVVMKHTGKSQWTSYCIYCGKKKHFRVMHLNDFISLMLMYSRQ